jgi:hypothetical protein
VGTAHLIGWNAFGLSTVADGSVLVPTGVSGAGIGSWKYPAGGKIVHTVLTPSGVFGVAVATGTAK